MSKKCPKCPKHIDYSLMSKTKQQKIITNSVLKRPTTVQSSIMETMGHVSIKRQF